MLPTVRESIDETSYEGMAVMIASRRNATTMKTCQYSNLAVIRRSKSTELPGLTRNLVMELMQCKPAGTMTKDDKMRFIASIKMGLCVVL